MSLDDDEKRVGFVRKYIFQGLPYVF